MLKAIDEGIQTFGGAYFDPEKKLTLELAALFHDADDRKYFDEGSENAKEMIEELLEMYDGGENHILKSNKDIV